MSQQQDDMRDLCRDMMKNGLLLAERTEELVVNYQGDNVEDVMVDVVREMLSNATDPGRQLKIIQLSGSMGERLGSEKLQRFAQQAGETWQKENQDGK